VTFDHACHLGDRRQPAVVGPPVPFLEERLGVLGGLGAELLEREADAVGPPGLEVGGGEVVQLSAPVLRQVARVLEPEIAAFLDRAMCIAPMAGVRGWSR